MWILLVLCVLTEIKNVVVKLSSLKMYQNINGCSNLPILFFSHFLYFLLIPLSCPMTVLFPLCAWVYCMSFILYFFTLLGLWFVSQLLNFLTDFLSLNNKLGGWKHDQTCRCHWRENTATLQQHPICIATPSQIYPYTPTLKVHRVA